MSSLRVLTIALSVALLCPTAASAYVTWGRIGSTDGNLNGPRGVGADGNGNVYVADTGNYRIQKFSGTGQFLAKWGSNGSGDGQFAGAPKAIAVSPAGDVYVEDGANQRIERFDASGAFVSSFGPGSGEAFSSDMALALAPTGELYVGVAAPEHGPRVLKYSSSGTLLGGWGSEGSGDGQFSAHAAMSIAVNQSGDVYVLADNRVQQFTSGGVFVRKFGSLGNGDGQFNGPAPLAIASDGGVLTSVDQRIMKFSADGSFQWRSKTCATPQPAGGSCSQWVGLTVSGSQIVASDSQGNRIEGFTEEEIRSGSPATLPPPSENTNCKTPPAGQVGISINGGDQYTNDPDVTLNVVWPTCAASLTIANDGGFSGSSSVPIAATVPWTLNSSGPERLPKTVYLRFDGVAPNYTDDIILDETPPAVTEATVVDETTESTDTTDSTDSTDSTDTTDTSARAVMAKARKHRYKLRLRAKDKTSGVRRVQLAAVRGKPLLTRRYQARFTVKLAKRPRYVRARDGAGNWSRWRKLR